MKNVQNSDEYGLVSKTLVLFVMALFALCVFQSSALQTLAYDLPAGGWTEKIIALAEGWHNLMQRCGAAQITESVLKFVVHIHGRQIED